MKVVVASGSPLLRAVLAEALAGAEGITSVREVDSVTALTESIHTDAPRVVLASPTLADGPLYPQVTEILRSGARVLVVCRACDAEEASVLLFAGATGCVLVEDAGAAEIVTAVRDIAAGHAALHPTVAATVLTRWRAAQTAPTPVPAVAPPAVDFTVREREVLDALARGLATKSIGRELGVSPKTVEAHISRVLSKLGARNRAQALAVAMDQRLLASPPMATPPA